MALPECGFNVIDCAQDAVGAVGGAIANAGGNAFADMIRGGAKWVIENSVGFWLKVPSIDLASSPAAQIRDDVLFISAAVATIGFMWAGIRLCLTRKAEPLWDLFTGVMKLLLTWSIGFVVAQSLLRAGDEFSVWVFHRSVDEVGDKFLQMAGMTAVTAPGAIIFFGIILILSGLAQAILMFLREGGIVILSAVMVLAAAGGFNPATKSWWPRVFGWNVSLILYKPFAALVYAAAFHFMGGDDSDPREVFIGITMILLAIVALPAMIKFFSWAAPTSSAGGSGLGGAAAALAGAGIAAAAMRGGGSGGAAASGGGASQQAASLDRDLGPAMGPPPPGGAGGAPSGAGAASATAGGASSSVAAVSPHAMALMAAVQAAGAARDAGAKAMTGGGDA